MDMVNIRLRFILHKKLNEGTVNFSIQITPTKLLILINAKLHILLSVTLEYGLKIHKCCKTGWVVFSKMSTDCR